MVEQTPNVGSPVHFVYGTQHVPAIITQPEYAVDDPAEPIGWIGQALTVFPVNAAPFSIVTRYDPDGAPATWHWPESVPATP